MLELFQPKKKKPENKGLFLAVGALVGGVLASVATVFLTPVSGKTARKNVTKKTKKGVNWVTKEVDAKKGEITKLADKYLPGKKEESTTEKPKTKKTTKKSSKKTTSGESSKK
jgi:gas vesicle protein